jgi:uncharacterized protein (DUF433 family)
MDRASVSPSLPITVDPNIVSGTPVFRGTRVPVQTLFDYIADGCTLDEFLDNFPTVRRADALQVLESIGQLVMTGGSA